MHATIETRVGNKLVQHNFLKDYRRRHPWSTFTTFITI